MTQFFKAKARDLVAQYLESGGGGDIETSEAHKTVYSICKKY